MLYSNCCSKLIKYPNGNIQHAIKLHLCLASRIICKKKLFILGNIFCFILFHNKVTRINKLLEISRNIKGRTWLASHLYRRRTYCKKGNVLIENNLYTDAKQLNHLSVNYFILFCVFVIFTIIYISYPEKKKRKICLKNPRYCLCRHPPMGIGTQSSSPTVYGNQITNVQK